MCLRFPTTVINLNHLNTDTDKAKDSFKWVP